MDLKPCPFCGGEAVLDNVKNLYYFCTCKRCRNSTGYFLNRNEAIKEWNERYIELTTLKKGLLNSLLGNDLEETEE